MEDRIKRANFGTIQPNIENLLDLTDEDFAPASEKEHFNSSYSQNYADLSLKNGLNSCNNGSNSHKINENSRKNTSFWQQTLHRLIQDKAAMAAAVILLLYIIFAFIGPELVPYGYDEFNKGAENLYPWHYSLEDQKLLDSISGNDEERLSAALEKAEKEKVSELTSIDVAKIKATVKATESDVDEFKKENNIHLRLFGYAKEELERIASGEKVFPHVFGTDKYGRDIMVRLMLGTRVSMLVGIFAAFLVLIIGASYGAISGFAGGKVDTVMMRFIELIYSLPDVLIVLLLSTVLKPALVAFQNGGDGAIQKLVGVLGPNLISLFVAFALLYWVTMARIIRGQILQLKEQEFVTAARALGAGSGRIIMRHLLPNCVGQIVVTTCLQIPEAIFLESFLSFLGIGVAAPMTSLGSMCAEALGGVETFGYRLVIPAILLSVLILSFNLIGDGLRDALDPRLKK